MQKIFVLRQHLRAAEEHLLLSIGSTSTPPATGPGPDEQPANEKQKGRDADDAFAELGLFKKKNNTTQ